MTVNVYIMTDAGVSHSVETPATARIIEKQCESRGVVCVVDWENPVVTVADYYDANEPWLPQSVKWDDENA